MKQVTAVRAGARHPALMTDLAMIVSASNGALRAGTEGISRGLVRATEAASSVARAAGPAEYADAAVRMLEAKAQVGASAAAVRSADRMLGTLLDVFA